jgi:hypothetical protein
LHKGQIKNMDLKRIDKDQNPNWAQEKNKTTLKNKT